MRDPVLQRAAKAAGGVPALAEALGRSRQALYQWERCPAELVLEVERLAHGKVTRFELRPDLYPREKRAS